MRATLSLLILLVALPVAAQTPEPTGPGDRLGFSQQTTATELPMLSWEIYLDNVLVPQPAQSVTCAINPSDATRYNCVGNYPAMTPGTHRIELVTVRTEGTLILRSPRSTPFDVDVKVNPNAATGLHNVRGS